MFIIATFYHFFRFPGLCGKKPQLLALLKTLGIKGSILLASEGVNGTLAGTREAIDTCLAYLKNNIIGGAFEHKESLCDHQPLAAPRCASKKN